MAEKLEETGFNKGRTEGRIEEKRRIARQMLQQKADSSFIEKVTGLNAEKIELLASEK